LAFGLLVIGSRVGVLGLRFLRFRDQGLGWRTSSRTWRRRTIAPMGRDARHVPASFRVQGLRVRGLGFQDVLGSGTGIKVLMAWGIGFTV